MKLQQWLSSWFKKLAVGNWTARQLAISFCVGVYIAFSPFPGLHTWMVLVAAWAFSLNVVVLFASSCLINNPWTMIPVYGLDFLLGQSILCSWFGSSSASVCSLDPAWMSVVNKFLHTYIGIEQVSLWGFLLGGNILGIVAAFALYLPVKYMFEAIKREKQEA
jgi:uncharacterized protein (DUF2062 family)